MSRALILLAYIAVIPAATFGVMGAAFWLSDNLHEFGPYDLRYLLLIHGSNVARLDLVEPVSGSVRYAGQGQEGTAPARAFVDFKTTVSPERIIDIYESRCRAIGLVPQRQPSKDNKLVLHCTNESTELGIGAIGTDNLTSVTVGGWQFEK